MHIVAKVTLFTLLTLIPVSGGSSNEHKTGWFDFGGPSDDFQSDSRISPWPDSGPTLLWESPLGDGYSAISADDRGLFTLFRAGENDVVVSLDAESGKTRWQHRYSAPPRKENLVQFGTGPNSTPLVLEDQVVTLGYTGFLKALDRESGAVQWQYSLIDDFGGDVLRWGYSASPILYDGRVIVLVGGPQGVVAFDPANGDVAWKSRPSTVSYSTPRVLSVAGRNEMLFFSKDALRSIDPANGKLLWSHRIVNGYENHASNLLWDGNGLLWVASQQEAAGRVLRLSGSSIEPEVVWKNGRVRIHHWNAVLIDGVVYASLGDSVKIFSAVDLRTGRILWRDRRIGLATLLHTPTGTLALQGDGTLFFLKLSRQGLEILARSSISQSVSWTVPTLVGKRLFVRDKKQIRAFDLPLEEKSGTTVQGAR